MLKFWKHTRSATVILVGVLLVLLATLATLQYRWLGQVSEGERERIQAALRAGALRFSEDFDRELARAFISFQMDGQIIRSQASGGFAERYARWDATAPHPQLVAAVYLVEINKENNPRILRFEKSAGSFKPSLWPSYFETLRQRFERQTPAEIRPVIEGPLPPPFIDTEPPVLIIPVVEFLKLNESELEKPGVVFRKRVAPPQSYLIVALNSTYLKDVLVPTLARRYFSNNAGDGTLDYNLRIVSRRDPQKTILNLGPQLSEAASLSASGDATANFFSLRPDAIDSFSLPTNLPSTGEASMHAATAPVALRLAETPAPANAIIYRNDASLWQLIVKHREGSLDQAVASVRRRNMIISFSILLVLAASIVLIFISTQRAQRLAQQQLDFVAGVSHELRTPVAVVCSAGANLADGVVHDRENVRRYGALIRSQGHRLAEMVEQVLEFAGTRSIKEAYHLHPVEVLEVIEDALEACQPQISEKGFKIEKMIEPDLPQIMADAGAIGRAVQNLLSNAMKYSAGSQSITISARTQLTKHGAEMLISIEDQGLGIHPDDLPHIFEPFRRGREAMAAQIHGNGLGLTLLKRIVEAHSGRVSVKSAPGHGSTFTLHLPLAPQPNGRPGLTTEGRYEQAHPAC